MLDFKNARLDLFMRVLRECGDIGAFHIGPVRVVFISSSALISEMLVEREAEFGGTRVQDAFLPLMGKHALPMVSGEVHRQHRKMHASAFQPRRLTELARPMVDLTQALVAQWREGQEVELEGEMTRLTMRIVGKALMGVELEQTDELAVAFRIVDDYITYLVTSLLPVPLGVPIPRNVRVRGALDTIRSHVRRFIREHRQAGVEQNDLITTMLQASDDAGQPLSDEQLLDHMVTMFGAGHETVAATITWVWYLLMRHPEVQARVLAELDSVLGGRPPAAGDLPKLPYGQWVLRETMRLYPASYLIARSPKQDTTLGGYRVKKGEMLLVCPYALHRNPQYFGDPERFDPERFSPENDRKFPRHAYLPFGSGPHVCIGNHFALMELQLIMSQVLQRVTFEPLDPGLNIVPVAGAVLDPIELRARVRFRASAAENSSSCAAA